MSCFFGASDVAVDLSAAAVVVVLFVWLVQMVSLKVSMCVALWSAGQSGPWLRTVWHVLLEQKLTQSPSGPEIGQV